MADKQITFKVFCDVCENIQKQNKFLEKEKVLLTFINKYKKLDRTILNDNDTFYPVLRLLIPDYERERPPYGLKETSFSKLFVRTLCLQGTDANTLLKYNTVSSKNSTDFADVAYWILRKWCPKTSTLTIANINEHLDQMSKYHAEHKPREVEKELNQMIKTSTALEQKWIIRIILKNMHLKIGNDRILKIFHPDAADLYDVCSNLSKVCTTLKDQNTRLHELEIEIFTPFRPMLSLQCDSDVLNQVIKNEKIYYVENKFDGERFQLHMKNGVFKYFSKNGYDYSNVYGENYNSGLITRHLKLMFSKIESIILDGEMMGWNTKTNNFGSKGMNFDVKTLKSDNVHRPCFCVFDVLYFNGKTLTNNTLSQRVQLLDHLFEQQIDGIFHKSLRFEAKTKQDLMQELNKSVDRQEEGICFKDSDSIYKPNNRKGGWWKMKLEYFDGLMNELDLIILGGYFGEGRRKGLISSFLLGVAVNPKHLEESPNEFFTFARVASGFTDEEFNTLLNKLNPYWIPFKNDNVPDGVVWKKEKPDYWIEPRKSCILQVKASELVKSTDFQTGYTLRFPRVVKIRYDKPWYNCFSLDELNNLTKNNKAVAKLSGRHITEDDVEVSPTKKRRSNESALYHLINVEQKSTILAGKEFCVFTGNEHFTKEDIEVKIIVAGGKVVQFSGPNTMCTLIGNLTPRANYLISTSTNDIVKLDWILRILDSSSNIVKLLPDDMIVTSNKTQLLFSNQYDKYRLSYKEIVDVTLLKKILNTMSNDHKYLNLLPSEFMEIDKMLSFRNSLGIFRNCFAYFDKYEIVSDSASPQIISFVPFECDFIFYGGKICKKIEYFTTHIIMQSRDISRIEIIKEMIKLVNNKVVKIVNSQWINNCITSKNVL